MEIFAELGVRKKLTNKILTNCISLTCKQLSAETLNGKTFDKLQRICAIRYVYLNVPLQFNAMAET